MDALNPRARRDRFGSKINRAHSPILATTMPWVTIMSASFLAVIFIGAALPAIPPLGYLMLLGWRLLRPGLLPSWAGLPLGFVDDLFSGQPFGSAILLWSVTLLVIEAVEARFPWRGFVQDWFAATMLTGCYLALCALFSGAGGMFGHVPLIGPQFLLSILLFPPIGRLIASLDRLRLLRIRSTS